MKPLPFIKSLAILSFVLASFSYSQTYKLDLGNIYLPSVVEEITCPERELADFGFKDELDLLDTFVFRTQEGHYMTRQCYLFRGLPSFEQRKMVATIMRDFAAQNYFSGIPRGLGGLHLLQGEEDKSLVGFSYFSDAALIGPDSGVAGFEFDTPDGLILHLWAVYVSRFN